MDVHIVTIKDGWSRHIPFPSRKAAERTARALWATGEYELVKVQCEALPFGFFRARSVSIRQLLKKP